MIISPLDPASPEFAARRAAARRELDAIDPAMQGKDPEADPVRRDWFEAVYMRAGDDPARVPWANLAPHPLTRAWVTDHAGSIAGLRTLDVGCGLGDNAECFAAAGAEVVAFDLAAEAIAWAKRRFPQSSVQYRQADLLDMPEEWHRRFDVVHECYTLHALYAPLLPRALAALATVLAPGGRLLLISRARSEDEDPSGPPWPLPPSFFEAARSHGLEPQSVEDIPPSAGVGRRHRRAVLRRVGA